VRNDNAKKKEKEEEKKAKEEFNARFVLGAEKEECVWWARDYPSVASAFND